jgi:hypothetical protein
LNFVTRLFGQQEGRGNGIGRINLGSIVPGSFNNNYISTPQSASILPTTANRDQNIGEINLQSILNTISDGNGSQNQNRGEINLQSILNAIGSGNGGSQNQNHGEINLQSVLNAIRSDGSGREVSRKSVIIFLFLTLNKCSERKI